MGRPGAATPLTPLIPHHFFLGNHEKTVNDLVTTTVSVAATTGNILGFPTKWLSKQNRRAHLSLVVVGKTRRRKGNERSVSAGNFATLVIAMLRAFHVEQKN
jgi:hypothetical protein